MNQLAVTLWASFVPQRWNSEQLPRSCDYPPLEQAYLKVR